MGKGESIYPDNAIYLSVVPAGHPSGANFVVVSYQAHDGTGQLAFNSEDGEKLVAGLIEALASQQNPVGQLLLDSLREATEDISDEADTEAYCPQDSYEAGSSEGGKGQGFDGLDPETDDGDTITFDVDPFDTSGDDFGTDA